MDDSGLPEIIADIVEDLPIHKRPMAIAMLVENNNTHSHEILPSPAVMEFYETKVTGATELMLTLAEKEMDHRHTVEKGMITQVKLGSFLGMIAFTLLLAAIIFTVIFEKDTVALGLCTIGAVGIIGNFVNSHKQE